MKERLSTYVELIERLPPANRAGLTRLVRLLATHQPPAAAAASDRAARLAAVLVPVLLLPPTAVADDEKAADKQTAARECLRELVLHAGRLFGGDEPVGCNGHDDHPSSHHDDNGGRRRHNVGLGLDPPSDALVEVATDTAWSFGVDHDDCRDDELSVVVTHRDGGSTRARLRASLSPSGQVVLTLISGPPSPPTSSSSSSAGAPLPSSAEASSSSSSLSLGSTSSWSLLLGLPTEIQQHIYSFLPIGEILTTLALVCRDVHNTTQRDDVFWHGIYDLHFGGPTSPAPSAAASGSSAATTTSSVSSSSSLSSSSSSTLVVINKARARRELYCSPQQQQQQQPRPDASAVAEQNKDNNNNNNKAEAEEAERADEERATPGEQRDAATAAEGGRAEDEADARAEQHRASSSGAVEQQQEGGVVALAPPEVWWRRECVRLLREIREMEEDHEREMAVVDVEMGKKKRKKIRAHKRRRIKWAVEKGHLPLMRRFLSAADLSVDVPLTEKVLINLLYYYFAAFFSFFFCKNADYYFSF